MNSYQDVFFCRQVATGLLKDNRFSQMFSNTAFQIDTESDEYRLVHPLVSKLDKDRRKHNALTSQFSQVVSLSFYSCSLCLPRVIYHNLKDTCQFLMVCLALCQLVVGKKYVANAAGSKI